MPRVGAVVLAAGASRRMGSPKPLLQLGDSTYLGTVLGTLALSTVATVDVVLGCEGEAVLRNTDWKSASPLMHEGWRSGMLSSFQAGIERLVARECVTCPYDAALLVPVDIPRFAPATLEALLAAWKPEVPIVVPSHKHARGHPVLFSRSMWSAILSAPRAGGAAAVVRATAAAVVEVEDPWILRDADTPEQHLALQAGELTQSFGERA